MVPEPLFTIKSKWCESPIILTPERWQHAIDHHPEVEPYQEQVRLALEDPHLVYDTEQRKPTLSFYRRHLITEDHRFRGCYVAVFVRHKMSPSCVWTAYLPARLSGNPGKLLHARK